MSDPHAERRVNATIKYPESKRYAADNPWLTFEGSVDTVRAQIIEAFGMDDARDLTLAELVSEAQSQFTAMGNAKHGLGGGKILSSGKGEESNGSAWDKVGSGQSSEAAPKEPEENPVITAINACRSVDELQTVWAENQPAFEDEAVMAAYKSKGKALQG